MAKKKAKITRPPLVYHRHMQSHEVSVLYVFSRWPGIVGPHDVVRLEADGYVADGKVTLLGRKRLEQLGETGEGYEGFGKSAAHAPKTDD
jgi:hypothetical protein